MVEVELDSTVLAVGVVEEAHGRHLARARLLVAERQWSSHSGSALGVSRHWLTAEARKIQRLHAGIEYPRILEQRHP